ncbi:YbjN domain-containing protein [Polaromonas sp.]|uniref:YbjN domain-containing protein n=1 Tax=Polaromonas sp. TaxID=1869339 RepID=UPI0013B7F9B1|nr:YbjN domain-containing protein [Polaromonas sp.]NDP63454.1 YbjN domain-containing protein [Polaromonas sp.]
MCNLIEEKDVTPVTLSLELETAVIEHKLEQDEDIYVTEGGVFPCWIKVIKNSGYIGFTSYIMFRKTSSYLDRLELANRFNKRNYMTTNHVDGDKLMIDHVLCYKSGILKETFIRGLRQYSSAICNSITEIDPGYIVLLPLGETESNETTNEQADKPEV